MLCFSKAPIDVGGVEGSNSRGRIRLLFQGGFVDKAARLAPSPICPKDEDFL
jgi:hypothetical protein